MVEENTFGVGNKVELVGFYGSDETHALSAWTSTSRDLDIVEKNGKTKRSRIPGLLKNLADNKHHTPFEKSSLHFLATTDIASHIQLLKHRIGTSLNGESARYKELKEDKLYLPFDWPEDEKLIYLKHMEDTYAHYHRALVRLERHFIDVEGLNEKAARNRAKESARFYLPYGNQLTCDVMFNFRSFAHFVGLRYSNHAQREIRNIAKEMLLAVQQTGQFNETLKAFRLVDENGVLVPPFD